MLKLKPEKNAALILLKIHSSFFQISRTLQSVTYFAHKYLFPLIVHQQLKFEASYFSLSLSLLQTKQNKKRKRNPFLKMVKGREYERLFDYLDENRDGKVSPSELKNRMGMMGGDVLLNEVEVAIESLDKDGDGMLDFEDLVGLIEGASDEDKLNDLRVAFGLYDVDNCGFITPTHLKRMLAKLGESKSIDECKRMIHQFDLNGDGVLCFEEFRVMMQ